MLTLHSISYRHPDGTALFRDLGLSLAQHEKAALIGANGSGKSTLLRIIAGELAPAAGRVEVASAPWLVPQHFGQCDGMRIGAALRVEAKVRALQAILSGSADEEAFLALDDDWDVEERCAEALAHWGLEGVGLMEPMGRLSGGEKTRVFLAGIRIHRPDLVLLDEPTNHLDRTGREAVYGYVASSRETLLIVSHDRELLALAESVVELTRDGIAVFGGSFAAFSAQRAVEEDAMLDALQNAESSLRAARRAERETTERKQRRDVRGKGKLIGRGIPKIVWNKYRDTAEASGARMSEEHAAKIAAMAERAAAIRAQLPEHRRMRMNVPNVSLHGGKVLVEATALNHGFGGELLWPAPLDVVLRSGERVQIAGPNGSGKTTLLRLLLGELTASTGSVRRAEMRSVCIDQDYTLVRGFRTVFELARSFNTTGLEEHELRIRLHRHLFDATACGKPCEALSGGERLRLLLCCVFTIGAPPDLVALDEPTNNLDLQNIGLLTRAIAAYRGTVLVISHDRRFLEEIGVERVLEPGA
jgi:ATPase subunit of ABC transporter with duplicated ATPase domains